MLVQSAAFSTRAVLEWRSSLYMFFLVFTQGDAGKSWYVILKGSVQCVVYGKGIVGTFHEGDDFGKLSLVNNSPRFNFVI